MVTHPPRAFPWEIDPPVGTLHVKRKRRSRARVRRPRLRECLRKGCRRKYQPRRWNQRYCQDPECLRLVRQWQAAKRQAKHRQTAEAKARHAQAEHARRERAKFASQTVQKPEVAPQRGHAADPFFPLRYAIGPAATNRLCPRSGTRHVSAAPPAVRQFAMSSIVNASGVLAARWMAARSEPTNTRRRANAGPRRAAMPGWKRPRDPLRSDDSAGLRWSSIIAWLLEGTLAWAS